MEKKTVYHDEMPRQLAWAICTNRLARDKMHITHRLLGNLQVESRFALLLCVDHFE